MGRQQIEPKQKKLPPSPVCSKQKQQFGCINSKLQCLQHQKPQQQSMIVNPLHFPQLHQQVSQGKHSHIDYYIVELQQHSYLQGRCRNNKTWVFLLSFSVLQSLYKNQINLARVMNEGTKEECYFLCFRKCSNQAQEDEQLKKLNKFSSFEKLSLKRIKEDNYHINRTQSFKKIERPIPTTERSAEQGSENYLLHLLEKKRKTEGEIMLLNQDFDKCFQIYNKKLRQLKEIQMRLGNESRMKLKK